MTSGTSEDSATALTYANSSGTLEEGQDVSDGDSRLERWEERLWAEGFHIVAGTDEAGRGPLAGPVTAGAYAVLDGACPELRGMLVQIAADSKKLSAEERDAAYLQLTDPRWKGKVAWTVSEASPAQIDQSNILRASLTAMAEAVQHLEPRPDCVLVDGCNRPPELLKAGELWTRGSKAAALAKADTKQTRLASFFGVTKPVERTLSEDAPWRPRCVEAVINGDAQVVCISAASIIAKVHRDRKMVELDKAYPVYGFADHKGYPTASHLEAIKIHGVCPEHRRSYGPVKEALGESGLALASSPGGVLAALGVSATLLEPRTEAGTPAKTPVKTTSAAATATLIDTPVKNIANSSQSVQTENEQTVTKRRRRSKSSVAVLPAEDTKSILEAKLAPPKRGRRPRTPAA